MDSATPSPTGLDPLTFSDDLQKVGLTQPQATTVARWWGKLATKEDLRRVKTHLSDKIGCVRKEMRDKFEKVYEKFGKVDEKFEKMHDKIDKNVYILLGGMTVLIGIMTALLKLLP